jgi:hypothetical protein
MYKEEWGKVVQAGELRVLRCLLEETEMFFEVRRLIGCQPYEG